MSIYYSDNPEFGFTAFELEYKTKQQQGALLVKQTVGFDHDMEYKLAKTLTENSSMLAQADQATPVWMVDTIKLLGGLMTEGRINIKEENGSTVVEYNPSSETDPNYELDQ